MAVNAGQTLNDRILAARHSIAGQGLAKAVCKATTEELIGPKKKHLDYLLHCTEEPNVSIPTLANLLIERTQSQNWITVFKGLVTLHHMMCYGNERFIQYLASSNTNFQLSSFLDKSAVHANVRGYDMSPFVRRHAKYLSEKSLSYRTVAFDFCKVRRGKEQGTLRQMSAEKLIKTLPTLQNQVDALLDFDVTTNDLNNGVINAAFMLLFRDLIRLFACYNDGIINLLEKYFDMNKKHARDALDLYKKFLIRMDRVADFLKVAEKFGIDKSDIPDLARAPSSLLEALEAHLANLEGRKPGSAATTPTATAGRVNVASAVNILSSTSTSFGGGAGQIDEKLQQQLLEEEEHAMKQFKEKKGGTNPFATAPEPASSENNTPNILDLFGIPDGGAPAGGNGASAAAAPASQASGGASDKASDDLLQLAGNPFASVLNATSSNSTQSAQSTAGLPAGGATSVPQQTLPSFSSSPFTAAATSSNTGNANGLYTSTAGGFATDSSFSNVFGNQNSTLDATGVGASFFGEILQPQGGVGGVGAVPGANGGTGNGTGPGGKLVSGDLDASLANLTSNLNLGAGQAKQFKADQQTKGPPMGSRMLAPTSNNNLTSTSGFNAANQNTMAHPFF